MAVGTVLLLALPLLASGASPPANDVGSLLVQRPQLLHQHKRVTPGWVGAVDPPYYEDQPLQAATKKTAEPESSAKG